MDITCDAKFSKPFTPDPHHIPGYTGHCPQLKFHCGKSYGKLTGELWKETHSDLPQVLSAESNIAHPPIGGEDPNRTIPGYMGFIPRRNKYIGCTYSEACRRARTEVQEEEERIRRSMVPPLIANTKTTSEIDLLHSALLQVLKSIIPPGNPYQMEDEHPQKYFISGFTGHVPKSRFLFGKGYLAITSVVLIEYGKQQRSK